VFLYHYSAYTGNPGIEFYLFDVFWRLPLLELGPVNEKLDYVKFDPPLFTCVIVMQENSDTE